MMAEAKQASSPVVFAKAMADSTRQQIMKYCCCEWRSVSEIVAHTRVTQPTVSHHLALLRRSGLVDVRSEGKQTFYRLNQRRIADCCGILSRTFAPEERERAG